MLDLSATIASAQFWRFDPSQLLPGDVLLERGDSWKSAAVVAIDGGRYSHALLCLGGSDFLEAVAVGARIISFARAIIREPDNWALLRLVNDPEAAARAASHARNLAHKPYNLSGVISTKLPLSPSGQRARLFCSQLVAEQYKKNGC